MKRLLLLATTFALAGCDLGSTLVPDVPSNPATETYASSLNINLSTMTRTADGVYYKDLVVGSGQALIGTGEVQVDYAGILPNGGVFTSGVQALVSVSQFVPGLQEGLQGMLVGGERLVIIPSELAYQNASGIPVPPNSTVLFDVRLDLIP